MENESTTIEQAQVKPDMMCVDLACGKMVQDLLLSISAKEFKIGDRLPTEKDLKMKYGISITSVRRGMEQLEREGLIARRRGSGTYVQTNTLNRRSVAPDTVVLCTQVRHSASHPYFGQAQKGLRERLAGLRWKVETANGGSKTIVDGKVEQINMDIGMLVADLKARGDVGGIVAKLVRQEDYNQLKQTGVTCVSEVANPHFPFVDYDWKAELTRATMLVLKAGARKILIIHASNISGVDNLARGAVTAVNPSIAPEMLVLETPISEVYSKTTYTAYEGVMDMLRRHGKTLDGFVIGSDFHAQGVFDALSDAGLGAADNIHVVSLVNRDSRIHTALPYTALVADGYQHGIELANLLDQRIRDPEHAPKFIYLSCKIQG